MTICHGIPWYRNGADDHCPFSIEGWWLFFYPLSYLTLTLYEQAGVREYWIVDPKAKSVLVYNFEHGTSGRYTFSELVKAGIYEDLFLDFGEVA